MSSSTGIAFRHPADRPAFPFYQRSVRLSEDYMETYLRDLAKSDGEQKGLDKLGWTICKFMFEIANLQARRRARCEMLKCEPPEAPWIYRDLYQLDQSDLRRCVCVLIPQDALSWFHDDGLTWFLSWQSVLSTWIGRDRYLGRRPQGQPALPMIAPREAYKQLAAT